MERPSVLVISGNGTVSSDLREMLESQYDYDVRVLSDCDGIPGELSGERHQFIFVDDKLVSSCPDLSHFLQCPRPDQGALQPGIILLARNDPPRSWRVVADSQVLGSVSVPVTGELLARVLNPIPLLLRTPAAQTAPQSDLRSQTRRFITETPELIATLENLEVAAAHHVTVLLVGETGTGKTFLARLMHEISPWRENRFLHVACGALPADLIESELFGHVKGAFTGADQSKEGKFEAAGAGTLLLDEIDVLGPEQQTKLLRVIETGEFEPVGCNETRKANARLIVASNLDLETMIANHRFRADLYYRLKVLEFQIPPLRRRIPDVVPLAMHFMEKLREIHRVPIKRIHPDFLDALLSYHWPGNVRELENMMCRSVLFCRNGEIGPADLPSPILQAFRLRTNGSSPSHTVPALASRVAVAERDAIEQSLKAHNYNRAATARALGISRVGLYKKLKKYGMVLPHGRSTAPIPPNGHAHVPIPEIQ